MFLALCCSYSYYAQTFGQVCYAKQLCVRSSLRAVRVETRSILVRIRLDRKEQLQEWKWGAEHRELSWT